MIFTSILMHINGNFCLLQNFNCGNNAKLLVNINKLKPVCLYHTTIIYVLIYIGLISISFIYDIGILETLFFTSHMKSICILFPEG